MVIFLVVFMFFFSSRRRHTRCALVTGVQTCALPISNTPIVIGTTGLEAQHQALIDAAAAQVAVLQAANTSLGVNLIGHLVREAAARLGPDWDIEVLEMHHRDRKSTRLNSSH